MVPFPHSHQRTDAPVAVEGFDDIAAVEIAVHV
jgi:hypothetical protein